MPVQQRPGKTVGERWHNADERRAGPTRARERGRRQVVKVLDRDAYDRYLNSPTWRAKRELAANRYERSCQACATTEALHVHHVTYERFGAEDLEDLRVLCSEHHDLAHHLERAGGYKLRAATDLVISAYTNTWPHPWLASSEHTKDRPSWTGAKR
jgi:5-methylcytosine-specific restriction endonuclease McrA